MPQPRKGPRLGSGPAHQRLMLAGLAAQLFTYERINTTEARAKAVRPVAERLITFAKRGDVAARREALKVVPDRDVVHRLFAEIGPRMADRPGGYTRILKLGPRKGDGAPMAVIELVDRQVEEWPRPREAGGRGRSEAPTGVRRHRVPGIRPPARRPDG